MDIKNFWERATTKRCDGEQDLDGQGHKPLPKRFGFGFAIIAFFWLYPLAEAALQAGRVDKIRIGLVEIELAAVPLTRPDEEKAKLSVEAGADLISADSRERISARFGQLAKQQLARTFCGLMTSIPNKM
jgi:hypothetical protein